MLAIPSHGRALFIFFRSLLPSFFSSFKTSKQIHKRTNKHPKLGECYRAAPTHRFRQIALFKQFSKKLKSFPNGSFFFIFPILPFATETNIRKRTSAGHLFPPKEPSIRLVVSSVGHITTQHCTRPDLSAKTLAATSDQRPAANGHPRDTFPRKPYVTRKAQCHRQETEKKPLDYLRLGVFSLNSGHPSWSSSFYCRLMPTGID